MDEISDLKFKLKIAENALRFVISINKKELDTVPGYVKIRMCRETAILAVEALKLKSINRNRIGTFVNIRQTCPWCGASVKYDWSTGVDYQCGNTASRLTGVTYKYCQFKDKL